MAEPGQPSGDRTWDIRTGTPAWGLPRLSRSAASRSPAGRPMVEEAADLRASIDQVRRTLDDVDRALGHTAGAATGIPPSVAPRRRRSGLRTVLIMVVVIGVVGGALAVYQFRGRAGGGHDTATADPAAPRTRPNLDWPGSSTGLPAGLPVAGPGADQPGDDITVTAGQGSTVEVYERALFAAPGFSGVRLVLPRLPGPQRPLVGGADLGLRDLEVLVDGEPARITDELNGLTIRSRATGHKFRSMVARYRLTGALLPRPDGADLVVTPLWGLQASLLGYPVIVRADQRVAVEAASCPAGVPAVRHPCGLRTGQGWQAQLPVGRRPAVVMFSATAG